MDTDDNVHYYMHTDIIYIAILPAWITNHLKLPKILSLCSECPTNSFATSFKFLEGYSSILPV